MFNTIILTIFIRSFLTVPIANVSSTKKIKSLVGTNHALLAQALKASTKLVRTVFLLFSFLQNWLAISLKFFIPISAIS